MDRGVREPREPFLYLPAMPTYEYRCDNGHVFEVVQRMADDPITVCEECGAPVQRVFHPVAVHFKGSGFYNTDYGTKKRSRELEKAASDGADKHDDKMASKKKDEKKAKDKGKDSSSSSSSKGSSAKKT
jgi:putative FmdB family regulatory protein